MNYQVPQNISKDKIFIVNRSEMDGRLDAQYYKVSINIPDNIKLSSIAMVKGGKRIPKGYSYSNVETPYYYLRVADMDSDSNINYGGLKCIDEDVYSILDRYEIRENELAISIAGTIGKICVVRDIPKGHRVILTENCAKILIKEGIGMQIEYLKILFSLSIIQKQLQLNYIQTTIPKLGLDRILNLRLPPLPSQTFQDQIVQIMDSAYSEKKLKDLEAQQLLDSIDFYILKELGITIPEIQKEQKDRIFISSFHKIEGKRIDPLYTLCWGKYAISNIYDSVNLGVIAKICKGNALTSSNAVSGNIPVIAGGQTSPYSHNEANFVGNVITVSASGAYAGYVWYHENPIYATDCNVIYSKDEKEFMTKFIYEVLRVQQKSIYLLQTGAAQPHVYASDLQFLKMPVVPVDKQQEIVNYIKLIRQQAKALQEEGKAILEDAKKEVERMIMQ